MEGTGQEWPPQLPGAGERSGSGQQLNFDNPLNLIKNIRGLVQQAREQHRGSEFNAAWWWRSQLETFTNEKMNSNMNMAEFANDLQIAYDVIAYDKFPADPDWRWTVDNELKTYMVVYERRAVTLNPLGAMLLDAMAEATDIPHTPGEKVIQISRISHLANYGNYLEYVDSENSPST